MNLPSGLELSRLEYEQLHILIQLLPAHCILTDALGVLHCYSPQVKLVRSTHLAHHDLMTLSICAACFTRLCVKTLEQQHHCLNAMCATNKIGKNVNLRQIQTSLAAKEIEVFLAPSDSGVDSQSLQPACPQLQIAMRYTEENRRHFLGDSVLAVCVGTEHGQPMTGHSSTDIQPGMGGTEQLQHMKTDNQKTQPRPWSMLAAAEVFRKRHQTMADLITSTQPSKQAKRTNLNQ